MSIKVFPLHIYVLKNIHVLKACPTGNNKTLKKLRSLIKRKILYFSNYNNLWYNIISICIWTTYILYMVQLNVNFIDNHQKRKSLFSLIRQAKEKNEIHPLLSSPKLLQSSTLKKRSIKCWSLDTWHYFCSAARETMQTQSQTLIVHRESWSTDFRLSQFFNNDDITVITYVFICFFFFFLLKASFWFLVFVEGSYFGCLIIRILSIQIQLKIILFMIIELQLIGSMY